MKKTDTYLYTAQRHTHGWLIIDPEFSMQHPGRRGLPMNSFLEVTKLPGLTADSVLHPGIAHALNAVMALGTKASVNLWADEIDAALSERHASRWYITGIGEAWLRGTKVGASSKTIFHALEPSQFMEVAGEIYGLTDGECSIRPAVPCDASDFKRCLHLVNLMGWRSSLHVVATTYPIWAKLVENWDELAAIQSDADLSKRIKELTK